jgi:exopolysaccharide biosynthesis protein
LCALGVAAAILTVDRKIARLQDAVNELRLKTTTEIAAALSNVPKPATGRQSFLFNLDDARRTLTGKMGDVTVQPVICDEATDFVRVSIKSPLTQVFLAVVDLTNPKVEVKMGVNLDKKTLTSSFARENDCTVAINGEAGNSPGLNSGLGVWRGNLVSLGRDLLHESARYPAPFLSFDQQNRALFISSAFTNRALPSTTYNAIWGRWDVLVNGVIQGSDYVSRQPRTTMAISQDGTRLFLMVADGRQAGYSGGMTLPAVGQLLLAFGAYNGMGCDEGGSSCIYLKKFGSIVNSPCDNNGQERPTYTHFGIHLRVDK